MTKKWTTKTTASNAITRSYPPLEKLNPETQKAIRYALYDNAPDIKPVFETKRWRFELQLWSKNSSGRDSDHKLVGYLSPLRTFGNLRYNKCSGTEWYAQAYENARVFDQTHNTWGVVAHCGIGRRHAHGDQNGFSLVPELTASVLIPYDADYVPLVYLQFGNLIDEQALDNCSEKPAFNLFWHYKEVE